MEVGFLMTMFRWLADGVARLSQRLPRSSNVPSEVSFTHLPSITEEITIPTRHGRLRVIRYSPPGDPASQGVYVNLHGGGFIIRHPEQDDALCRFLAFHAAVTVLNVDYIPAPQSRFPGPVEQAYDVAVWASSPHRPWDGTRLAVGGQSAGGALAAGTARLALEAAQPGIGLQVLVYPTLDLTVSAARKWTAGQETLLVGMGSWFNSVYSPDAALLHDRLASPAGTSDTASLVGIAPALVVSGERDILRDESARYAHRLREAGALVDHVDVRGAGHAFNMGGARHGVVLPVYEAIAESVRAAFA